MAGLIISLCIILGTVSTIHGRPRTEDEQLMIGEFLPALLDRLQNDPEYAYLLDGDDNVMSPVRRKVSPVQQDTTWPDLKFGQVAGVAVESDGDVLVFHRGDRKWAAGTFDYNNQLSEQDKARGPIQADAILKIGKNGTVLQRYGANKFYMPHGLTVDKSGNLWVTDVGLHQVMKIPAGSNKPTLVLGEAMKPGSDNDHFCKPTDVAVANNGDFFVSDGYCNGRIMKFSKDGHLIKQWGKQTSAPAEFSAPDELYIPHSVTLIEEHDMICVADREHGRIQCFNAGLTNPDAAGRFIKSISDPRFGKVFAISYDPTDKKMYIVNGATGRNEVKGFTVDLNGNVEEPAWGPTNYNFDEPHDIAVSPNGHHVYVAEIYPDRLTKFNK